MADIHIKQIAKSFRNIPALRSINLTIPHQEFMVLLGASGCGKTTLLRIIAGLEVASGGEVWIGGRRIDHLPPRQRGIAMVFQNYAVFPHMSVFDNIAFGLRMGKLPHEVIRKRVERTAELLHIEQLLKRYSAELSGGQRQRVAVARALAMEPDVILMDEPLSNLDALLRLEMRAELKGVLMESKSTAIYVTHDQVEAMSLADRICIMDQGMIVQSATPNEIYRNPATRFVASFIGSPPMNFLPAKRTGKGTWRVANQDFKGPDCDEAELAFAIRPEDIVSASSGLQAVVKVVEPLGSHTLVTCSLAGELFRVILESDSTVQSGQTLTLSPMKERIRWFHPNSNVAIQS